MGNVQVNMAKLMVALIKERYFRGCLSKVQGFVPEKNHTWHAVRPAKRGGRALFLARECIVIQFFQLISNPRPQDRVAEVRDPKRHNPSLTIANKGVCGVPGDRARA